MSENNVNNSVAEFMEALTTIVKTVKEHGMGPDAVMQILAEHGEGGEEQLRIIVEKIYADLDEE